MKLRLLFILFSGIIIMSCAITPNMHMENGVYAPVINPDDFVDVIDNPYMPMIPGTVKILEANDQGDIEKVVSVITYDTKVVMGVTCTVMWDREYENGELIENTYDWFAQDKDGNVWYFGEYSAEYEDGVPVSYAGSWEAGVDGALPGIVMPADPQVGDAYRQEYYEGEAEDMGEIIALNQTVRLPDGTVYEDCIKTKDWNALEGWVVEYKFYAPGIGTILEMETDQEVYLYELTTIEELDIDSLIADDSPGPIGLEAFVEFGIDAVNEEDERLFYITPGIEWEVFDTDLTLGLEWEIPVAPDPEIGEIGISAEYEIEFEDTPVLLYFGDENSFFLGEMEEFDEDGEEVEAIERFEGILFVGVEFFEIPFVEVDFYYLPEIELIAILGAEKEFYLRKGNYLGIGGALNIIIVEDFGIGDLEFDAYYSHVFGKFALTVGAEPVIEIESEEGEYEVGFVLTPYALFSFAF